VITVSVVFSLVASTGLSASKDPINVQVTRRAFVEAYRQNDLDRAVEIGLDLVQMGESCRDRFNLACIFALSGDSTSALFWLENAAAHGFRHVSYIDADPDIESVRALAGFAEVRDQVAANLRQYLEGVLRDAAANPPLMVIPKDGESTGPRPLVVVLHGYGDVAGSYPSLWAPVVREFGAILAVPSGPQRVGGGRGWGDVEQADVIVQHTIAFMDERFEIDHDRLVLTGFSQGGFMAMALGVRHPDLFSAVIPMAGGYIPEIDAPPVAGDGDPRFYFMVGANDRVADQVRRAASDFEDAAYEVELRVLPGTGHSYPRATTRELRKALRFALGE
jgi:predicted esterase